MIGTPSYRPKSRVSSSEKNQDGEDTKRGTKGPSDLIYCLTLGAITAGLESSR